MLEVDEHIQANGGYGEPSGGEEFSFLLETYYRLTGSLSAAAGGLSRTEDGPGDWAIFRRLEELLTAHRALHRWLTLAAELEATKGIDHVAALCARISRAVLNNQQLACHIRIDDEPLPGAVLQRFGLLLYETVQVLSVDALYLRRDGVRLQVALQRGSAGWLATVHHRTEPNSLTSRAVGVTVARAARRVGGEVDSQGTEAWCSVTAMLAGSREATSAFR